MGPRPAKHRADQIILSRSIDFNKVAEKTALTIVRTFWVIFVDFKVFAKMAYLFVKFNEEKHDCVVTEPI